MNGSTSVSVSRAGDTELPIRAHLYKHMKIKDILITGTVMAALLLTID